MKVIDADLLSMQEARIIMENVKEAQKILATFSQEKLDLIVNSILDNIKVHYSELIEISLEETDIGNFKDKLIKNKFMNEHLKQTLSTMKCVGVIETDKNKNISSIGVPMGIVVAFSSEISPICTTVYKAVIAIKSGNGIVFTIHPRAKKTMIKTLDLIIEFGEKMGLPKGAISYLSRVSTNGSKELINHINTSLVLNTGVEEYLEDIKKSGKPLIYGGLGKGPVFIEKSADIKKAISDILISKCFENGVLPGSEQAVVVDRTISCKVKEEFEKNNSYFMSKEESFLLEKLIFSKDGKFKREYLGRSPQYLSKLAGFKIADNIKVLISMEKFVSLDKPYSREKLCPVLSFYIEEDWNNACEKCIELLLNGEHGHTLIIHSKDENVINQFALKKPVGRILVNTPGVFGSLGGTTNLFPSMTLGNGLIGQGISSDNISPLNLIYVRKVGYEVKNIENLFLEFSQKEHEGIENKKIKDSLYLENTLKKLLREILQKYR